ncbi:MAG: hypothetical protein IJI25_06425 [Eubacterium sp.]|nr:hypothetical protein [Eubacterium sp.]
MRVSILVLFAIMFLTIQGQQVEISSYELKKQELDKQLEKRLKKEMIIAEMRWLPGIMRGS